MSLELAEQIGPKWNGFAVATFGGQHDTHIDTGEDYRAITLASIFEMQPQAKTKMAGEAFLPSTYRNYDARSHEMQREYGSFAALVGDIDKSDLPIAAVQAATERFANGAAWLIYSSAHSRDGDRRWRIILPLAEQLGFADWYDAQTSLFSYMEGEGIPMDRALSRAGQPVYLPNVPIAYKDGTPLRDEHGEAIYFETQSSGTQAPGLDISIGIVAGGISFIRQQRTADDREREVLRKAAAERFASRPQRDSANIIDQFNEGTSIATMLALCDYEQSPRSADDWRSPLQTGDTYATRIIENKWVSLSASDAAAGVGHKCKSGCFGDAYDLYVHYKHGGDHKSAYAQLGRESRGNVVQGNFRGEDPGWEEMPEWVQESDNRADYDSGDQVAEALAEVESDPLGFRITDWSTERYAGEAPPIKWLCEGSIPLAVPALFAAMGGVGKSFMALDMALEIAAEVIGAGSGRRILGGPVVEHGSVVVFGAEDAKDSVHRRMAAIDTGGRREGAQGRLFVIPLPDAGGPMTLISGNNGEFMQTAKLDAMIEQLLLIPNLKLVVFDPLQAFVASNITSDPAAGQFMWTSLARICALTGATVIACHHMRKDGAAAIATADQAREAIRGSTALIDGSRATYALWAASEDDTRRVCQEAGVEHRPKRVIHGAVVKANDEHDWEIHTYLRGDNGLLADAHEAGARAAQKSTSMTEMQCIDFLRKIDTRWRSGRPFSAANNTQDRYAIGFMQREYGVTKKVAQGQMDAWFDSEMVVSEMVDKKTKMVGLRVAKWPD
jgi:hypothetical protein